MSCNMVNFGQLTAEIGFGSLGHPYKFERVSRLGGVTARYSSSGRQPNFAALNRGRHLYLAGRPSRWALAHILVEHNIVINFYLQNACSSTSYRGCPMRPVFTGHVHGGGQSSRQCTVAVKNGMHSLIK